MKALPALIGAVLAATALMIFEFPWSASADPTIPTVPATSAASSTPAGSSSSEATLWALQASQMVRGDSPIPEMTATEIEQLADAQRTSTWLFDAMVSWTKVPLDPVPGIGAFEISHHDTAESFVHRLFDISEAVAKSHNFDGKRQALDIVAIAFMESGFRRWVDDGSCNTVTGLPTPAGEWNCDLGRAYTVWQFRPDLWYTALGEHHVVGADLLSDRQLAADKAWEKYSMNPAGWSTWRRAKALAERWAAKHPAP